jgi:light-regulated signal transduction histidine kinase (bacteriophytochrome)
LIKFGCELINGETVYFVRDNGVGFNMKHADKLFIAFQRIHKESDFEGIGVGLATVKRIINKHNGKIWFR